MKVFVTGGTGVIGTPVVAELLEHGHEVVALARSDASVAALSNAGATPVRGGLGDLDVLRSAATDADGVIQLAMGHDFSTPEKVEAAVTEEAAAFDTLGEAMLGTDKPLVVVSGTPWVAGETTTEHTPTPIIDGPLAGRGHSVNRILALADQGVRSSAVRMPRTVHNNGEGGFAGLLTTMARESGVAGYPGDGTQRWPAGHAVDAAALFRLALEKAPAGTSWHAVDDEGVRVRDIIEVIGRRLGLPIEQLPDEAFGPLASVFVLDQPSSSAYTRETLGWQPTHPRLLADLENLQP